MLAHTAVLRDRMDNVDFDRQLSYLMLERMRALSCIVSSYTHVPSTHTLSNVSLL